MDGCAVDSSGISARSDFGGFFVESFNIDCSKYSFIRFVLDVLSVSVLVILIMERLLF